MKNKQNLPGWGQPTTPAWQIFSDFSVKEIAVINTGR
jgi:hypothetical protein